MSAAAAGAVICKYGPKDCPFGKVCKFKHEPAKTSNRSKPAKAKAHVQEHVKSVQKHSTFLSVSHPAFKRQLASQARVLAVKRNLFVQEKKDFDSKYSLVDVKGLCTSSSAIDDRIALIDMELKTMRTMARNVFGNKPIGWDFHQSQNIVTSTVGVVNNVASVDPSVLSEFASLVALFEEYRVMGMTWSGFWYGPILQGTTSAFPLAVLAFDCVDNLGLTSVPNGCENAQHKLYPIPVVSQSAAVSAVTQEPTQTVNVIETFRFTIPSGTLVDLGYNAVGAGNWQPLAPASSTYYNYGYVKLYSGVHRLTAAGVATPVAYFETTYHAEIRIRD